MAKQLDIIDGALRMPFGLLLIGCPFSGKSSFIKNLLLERDMLLSEHLDYIVIFYGEKSKFINEIESEKSAYSFNNTEIILVSGLPDELSDYIREGYFGLFVFDDLMEDVSNSLQVVNLVTRKFQHSAISWCIVLQNAFHSASQRLSITRAATHIVIFNSPLDKTVPQILSSRIMPEKRKIFLDIFKDATRKPFGYLLCDGSQSTPDHLRLRSDIFNGSQIIYIPDSK